MNQPCNQHLYHAYAPIYDAIGEATFATELVARMLAARPHLPQRALDLACGTGAAALALAAHGIAVVGIDRAPAMLQIAKGRARDLGLTIPFVQADLRALPLETSPHLRERFDLITCCYDSLNYLTDDGDLERVFAAVAQLLAPGGAWVFDINSEAAFASWDESDQVVYDAHGLLVYNRLSYDPARHLGSGRIVWFSAEGGRWWRDEETHSERAWREAELEAALASAGLQVTARLSPTWEQAELDAPRVVYVAERRDAPLEQASERSDQRNRS